LYDWNFQVIHIGLNIEHLPRKCSCISRIICESCLGNVQETNNLF